MRERVGASEKRPVAGSEFGGLPISPSPACHRVQRHPFERIATPFQVYSWTAPQAEHAMDCVRAEDAYTSRLGYEEHIPGQVLAAGAALLSPHPTGLGSSLQAVPTICSLRGLGTVCTGR